MQTAPAPRRRRLAFALIAAGLGFVVALALVEITLRVAWTPPLAMAEFQQKGLYRELPSGNAGLTPGYRGTLQLSPAEPVTHIAIDSLGMRGPEPGPKRAGERRLLVVGDSLVFGYGVDDDATFSRCLEAQLREAGHDVTVGNGGVSGFNAFETARRVTDLRPSFRPDAVLFCYFLGNDAFENRNDDVAVIGGLRFAGPYARLMQQSRRARWMAHSRLCLWTEAWLVVNRPDWSLLAALQQVLPNPRLAGFPADRLDSCLFLDAIDPDTRWAADAPPAVAMAMADLRAALTSARTAADGLPLHVLLLPALCHVSDAFHRAELERVLFDPAKFRRSLHQQRARTVAEDLGLAAHDATVWFEPIADAAALYLSDRGHLSARGAAVVADHLARELAALWR